MRGSKFKKIIIVFLCLLSSGLRADRKEWEESVRVTTLKTASFSLLLGVGTGAVSSFFFRPLGLMTSFGITYYSYQKMAMAYLLIVKEARAEYLRTLENIPLVEVKDFESLSKDQFRAQLEGLIYHFSFFEREIEETQSRIDNQLGKKFEELKQASYGFHYGAWMSTCLDLNHLLAAEAQQLLQGHIRQSVDLLRPLNAFPHDAF